MHPYFCFFTCLKFIHSFLPYYFAQHPHANISFYFPTSYYNMQIYKVRNSDRRLSCSSVSHMLDWCTRVLGNPTYDEFTQ